MARPKSHRTPSAVRQSGDDFQHLVALNRILRALPPHLQLRAVELEAPDAGNVDDVVVRYDAHNDEFTQVRFAADLSTPLDTDYLLGSKPKGTSLLQKFHGSWRGLGGPDDHPHLQLITNRSPDPTDAVLMHVDGRTSSLAPALRHASGPSALVGVRAAWASHLDVDEDELLALLDDLKFRLGVQHANELERASDLMMQAGLAHDPPSVRIGTDLVRGWVLDSKRELTAEEVRAGVSGLGLDVAAPASTLLIQGFDHDPVSHDADVVLDWTDRYEDGPAKLRRRLTAGTTYDDLHADLRAATDRLRATGERRIVVRGAMRLSTWFAAGEALSGVQGVDVTCGQNKQFWSSTDASAPVELTYDVAAELGQGDELVVALAFAADPTGDVISFATRTAMPVHTVVRLGTSGGRWVSDGPEAVGYADAIKQATRAALRDSEARRVHLFLAVPAGLALLLGHAWNRVAPTVLWEDLGLDGYTEAFHIDA